MELDHVVLLVEDLEDAQQQWRAMGFNVMPGGVHADGLTHNALICFADGSYIELLAFRTAAATPHRWDRFRAFPGVIDYALAVSDLPAFVRRIGARGLDYSAPTEGGRQRPDGIVIRWRTSWPPQGSEGLPFLIEDLTPRELRVPVGEPRRHPNGAQGIAELTIAISDPSRAARNLVILFGNSGEPGAFKVGRVSLRMQHIPEGSALAQRGSGPISFAVSLIGERVLSVPDGLSAAWRKRKAMMQKHDVNL